MQRGMRAKPNVVLNFYVPSQRDKVRHDSAVADNGIMGKVHPIHKQVVIADERRPLFKRRSGNGDILAEGIPVADFNITPFPLILQIFRGIPNGGTEKDAAVLTNNSPLVNLNMGANLGAAPDMRIVADKTVRSDANALCQSGLRRDYRGWVNVCHFCIS